MNCEVFQFYLNKKCTRKRVPPPQFQQRLQRKGLWIWKHHLFYKFFWIRSKTKYLQVSNCSKVTNLDPKFYKMSVLVYGRKFWFWPDPIGWNFRRNFWSKVLYLELISLPEILILGQNFKDLTVFSHRLNAQTRNFPKLWNSGPHRNFWPLSNLHDKG
jgi:hypothetical protein